MRKLFLLLPFLLAPLAGHTEETESPERPKIAILLAIDQFPAWFLDEYAPVLDKGFRTLREEGRYFPVGLVNHAPTLSGAGHGSLGTGVNPAKHGFLANEWWAQLDDGTYRWQSIFEDLDHHFVGLPGVEQYSPKNLTAPTISEWFLANDPDTKVLNVGISEVTLLYAPRGKANTFWFSNQYGIFGTSTFFADEIPGWVNDFNQNFLADYIKENTVWDLSVPEEFRGLARPDNSPYEADKKNITFPHRVPDKAVFTPLPDASFPEAVNPSEDQEETPTLQAWFSGLPFKDLALIEFAKEGIIAMDLGGGQTTDLLTIALGVSDGIGHDYGTHSLEVLDYLMRLDAALADFIAFLDGRFGRDGYVLAISSDHGVAPAPEYTIEQGGEARRLTFAEIDEVLDQLEDFIADYEGERADFPESLALELEKTDFIRNAMTRANLEGDSPADGDLQLYRNGHVKGKTTDFPLWGKSRQLHPALFGIEVQFEPNTVFDAAVGIHGSPYDYDREVPILFFGGGVAPGVVLASPNTIDLAPTLANLAGVPIPEDVDGKILEVSK